MTPEEELKGLNKLIRQYETVFRTTSDPGQRDRAEKQLKELRGYRDKILAVNVIDDSQLEDAPMAEDELARAPLLKRLLAENSAMVKGGIPSPEAAEGSAPSSSQVELYHLSLYAAHLEKEFLPFLTEKMLKLDFKHAMDRDSFYNGLQALQRKLADYRREVRLIAEGAVSRDKELDARKRTIKLARLIVIDGARLFRTIDRFASDLVDDAQGDAVKCLNSETVIAFDPIEGKRLLEGQTVSGALAVLRDFAGEALAYLNIPEIEIQEN
jgi:hypothetical protein